MKLGFSLPTAGAWATPENQIRIAREAEALGYHSLWVFQRLLYALEPKNEYPPVPGKTWPKPFERVFVGDAFDPRFVHLVDFVTRMREPRREVAVVGEDQ